MAACGRRFGKSVVGGHELIPEALLTRTLQYQLAEDGKRREFWIVGPEYSDSAKEFRNFYNACKRLDLPFDRPGTYNDEHGGDMQVSLWDGTFIVIAKSAKMPDRLVGEGLSGCILAEAAKLKELIWTKYIRPALADFRGWSLHTSTPEGKNWFYEMWRRGNDPAYADWQSWRMPSWMNNHIFPDGQIDAEIIAMAQDMSPEKFKQEVEADFTEFVGRVFKDFDEELHVRDLQYMPRYPVYLAVDYGWTNPFVCLWIQEDVWGNVHVLKEYRAEQRDINDIADDLAEDPLIRNRKVRLLYPDPAGPGDTAVLTQKLRVRANKDTGGPLKHRLEYIRQGLKLYPEHAPLEDRTPRLMIDRSCTGLISEMQDYRYPDQKSELRPNKEEPLDKDNHGPEALGRFYRGFYGAPAGRQGKAHAKVTKARMRSAA